MLDPLMIVAATQIIIESLPISSSGHMMLAEYVMRWCGMISKIVVPDALNDMLHIPTLAIVAIYFYYAWSNLLVCVMCILRKWCKQERWSRLPDSNKKYLLIVGKIMGMVVCADIVTVCWYVGLKLMAKQGVVIECMPMLVIGFALTMLFLLGSCSLKPFVLSLSKDSSAENKLQKKSNNFLTRSMLLGFVQGMALLPGISRFASTVVTGYMLGMSWRRSLEFSFLIFTPLMGAVIIGHGLPALLFDGVCLQFLQPIWLVLFVLSSGFAYYLFSAACRLVMTGHLWWFGVYMVVPIMVSMLLMF